MAAMMATTITNALAAAGGVGDFAAGAGALLDALGYRSDRIAGGQSGDAGDFVRQFPALATGTVGERDFIREVESVRILFQVTDSEIAAAVGQPGLLDDSSGGFDTGNARSFLFAAVELDGDTYSRSAYAAFTREINKRLQMPTVILFRTAGQSDKGRRVTLAFVHRRVSLVDANRDVLGRVSLIREIDPANPHRAHLEILGELALAARLGWMAARGKSRNFDGLLDAWLAALDTEELNRQFYAELFEWFERAIAIARFPTGERVTLSPEDHTIRLITRLLFVWFLKEKGLVADALFVEHQAARLLKDYDRDDGDSYYRAILQNLFFATLNTEIGQRRFSKQNRDDHREPSVYRYRNELADPDRLVALLGQTPFVNGGLFDCLDSFDATGRGGYRVDCFTDNARQRAGHSIPNRLFFGGDDDASNPGDGGNHPGLIDLLERYMFTVEENTPVEQEVALDPELLGKVFENLLAAVNPETSVTVRKETGSYYTPRPVVDYMVDEALAGALASGDGDSGAAESIRRLLDYDDALADGDVLFGAGERERIVRAIAGLRVIDPAVGSGAFPMGILHKLTLALRRLDPDNRIWEMVQQEQAAARAAAAFGTDDEAERNAELVEISAIFQRYRDSDYGRKLYLIQNCIYGVDIQPIAVQIAKLRFFISLAIEQESDPDAGAAADNYGIRPLPNLETRLVAADTLLPLERPAQLSLGQTDDINELERAIAANRERHFHAVTRREKQQCRDRDEELRGQLASQLVDAGFPAASAGQIAEWNPFDQNAAAAAWFDAEYMFGVGGGFDVVIGNPPYIQLQKDGGRLGRRYRDAGFATYARTGDVYQLFYEKGGQLLTPQRGILAYITSNSWLKAEYGRATRGYLAARHTPRRLLEMGQDVFEQAIVDSVIVVLSAGRREESESASDSDGAAPGYGVDLDRLDDRAFPPAAHWWSEFRAPGERPWRLLTPAEQTVMDTMERVGTPLRDWAVSINFGIKTGYNQAFIIDDDTRQELVDADPKSAEIIKPVLRGRDIRRWRTRWAGLYLIATFPAAEVNIDDYPAVKNHLLSFGYDRLEQAGKSLPGGGKSRKKTSHAWFETQDSVAYYENFAKEKLFWADMAKEGRFVWSDAEMFCNDKGYIMTGQSLKYLCGVLNSALVQWYMQNTAPTTGMGLTEWKIFAIERIPVPRATATQRRRVAGLVDGILGSADAGEVARLEGELDVLVGGLYGLGGDALRGIGL